MPDIEAERARVRGAMEELRASVEPCGFCDDGVIRNHPSNGEDGWCPYCEGKGFRAPDCGCGQGAMCQEDNYGR